MIEEQKERWQNEALDLERKLTVYQALMIVSLVSGHPLNDLAEPKGEPSQVLELERLGILKVHDAKGIRELQLTSKGLVMAQWYGANMLEALGVDPLFLD